MTNSILGLKIFGKGALLNMATEIVCLADLLQYIMLKEALISCLLMDKLYRSLPAEVNLPRVVEVGLCRVHLTSSLTFKYIELI